MYITMSVYYVGLFFFNIVDNICIYLVGLFCVHVCVGSCILFLKILCDTLFIIIYVSECMHVC